MSAPNGPLDESQFLRLYLWHEGALRAFARALLPDWEAVDEALQEASVVMWKKLGQLDSAGGFLPWAKVIVRFEALRLRRRFSRDRVVFGDALLELLAREAADDPESTFERDRAALDACLTQLSPPHRELVLVPYAGDGRVAALTGEGGKLRKDLYTADNIHLSPAGYAAYAAKLKPLLAAK